MVDTSMMSQQADDPSDAFVFVFDAYNSLIMADEQGQYKTPYEAKKYLSALK